MMRCWGLVAMVACAGGDKLPSVSTDPGDTGAAEGSGGESTGGPDQTGQDSADTADDPRPAWLSWEGEEALTVDIMADGVVECIFEWRTSGLHRTSLCDDCVFDFDVVGVVEDDSSSCSGAAGFRLRRWWMDSMLYSEDGVVAPGSLEASAFTARAYTMDIDATYGAPVAMTWTISATLR